MKRFKYVMVFCVSFLCVSCVTGIFEMINGIDKYVEKNEHGRRELKTKKYKEKFRSRMADRIICDSVYYNYYEDDKINYFNHSYLRLFKTGQFAYFTSSSKGVDLNNLCSANFVGYYVVENNSLQLETPTGNFNTAHFRVIWSARINKDTLVFSKLYNRGEFLIDKSAVIDNTVKPDW
ncbi:MAG: hypothetical protein EOP00_26060 [Pedobacter sp.]|nr:MAG: hypothetical protein EOP00_26060 [Pedobacter sp.]